MRAGVIDFNFNITMYPGLNIEIPPSKHKLQRIYREEVFRNEHLRQFSALTRREKEVLVLLAKDLNSPEIADQLFISCHTVQQHRKNINRKLGINSMPQLFQYALAFDLI